MSKMTIVMPDTMPVETLIAAIEETGHVRVVGYEKTGSEIEFRVEPIEPPDPYRDLGFTHDFVFGTFINAWARIRVSKRGRRGK